MHGVFVDEKAREYITDIYMFGDNLETIHF